LGTVFEISMGASGFTALPILVRISGKHENTLPLIVTHGWAGDDGRIFPSDLIQRALSDVETMGFA
jgi:hypothetical protein